MSRQIQIRRGSATEHNTFIGAIGEITMDTTNKTLRVHDGETAGGTILARQSELPPATADYVIENQIPTAENNYTWYRKYKSGWVEQGGYLPAPQSSSVTISFPVEMATNIYSISVAFRGTNEPGGYTSGYRNMTSTGFTLMFPYSNSNGNTGTWSICGTYKK